MSEPIPIQWFPGHMAKTRRLMAQNLKLVDIVAELADARIPISSRNPEIDRLIAQKPRLLLLNKSDYAEEEQTRRWCAFYRSQGILALPTDCRSGKGLKALLPAAREVLAPQIRRWQEQGMPGRAIRVMVVGVPNVGKSSLINRLAKSRKTKVEDRPGVTRGKQWVTLDNGMELLDMPGVLWPKFEDPVVGEHLAFTGAVKDDILDVEALAARLLETLMQHYAPLVCGRYRLNREAAENQPGYQLLSQIARTRGMVLPGNEVNTERAAVTVLEEFRAGTLGRITIEWVDS